MSRKSTHPDPNTYTIRRPGCASWQDAVPESGLRAALDNAHRQGIEPIVITRDSDGAEVVYDHPGRWRGLRRDADGVFAGWVEADRAECNK